MGINWKRWTHWFKASLPVPLPVASSSVAAGSRRWVIADVESSGLDARRDRLLAIAAMAIHFDESRFRPQIVLADSLEVFIQQDLSPAHAPDKANILIHGIGVGAQRSGMPAVQALQAWRDFVGTDPLVAYHSAFDQTMIDRACRQHLGRPLPNPWLDLEPLAAVLHQDPRHRALDHWLQHHRISCLLRHQAAADTLATAQLLLALWPQVRRRVQGSHAQVCDLADSARFMPGRT